MPLQATVQHRPGRVRDPGMQRERQPSGGSSLWRRNATTVVLSVSAGTVDRGSFRPVPRCSTVSRFRHLATVLGSRPNARFSAAVEACDRCIAVRMACVVVAQPGRPCPIVLPSSPANGSHQQCGGKPPGSWPFNEELVSNRLRRFQRTVAPSFPRIRTLIHRHGGRNLSFQDFRNLRCRVQISYLNLAITHIRTRQRTAGAPSCEGPGKCIWRPRFRPRVRHPSRESLSRSRADGSAETCGPGSGVPPHRARGAVGAD